jgi:HK97 family phage portal protein/2'-5' RNA ligase
MVVSKPYRCFSLSKKTKAPRKPVMMNPPAYGTAARFVRLDGTSKAIKNAAEDHFNDFHGISTQPSYEFSATDNGYEKAWAASVWAKRCIEILANAFMALPVRCIDNRTGDTLEDNHPFAQLFNWRSQKLRWITETHYQIYGRAFWKPYIEKRRLCYMTLNPVTIEVLRNRYGVHGFIQRIMGAVTGEFTADELVYFYSYDPEDDLAGLPAIAWILRTIGVDISTEQFAKTFFENDATPGGLLTTDQKLQIPDQERLTAMWNKQHKGTKNKHRTAVMGDGVNYQILTPAMKDLAQDILDEKTKRRIAAAFGVPPTIALMDDSANFATAKESHIVLYTETVIPNATLRFDTINKDVAPAYGDVRVEVAKDQIEVLQEDRVEITTRSTQGFINGVRSWNEARELEGLPAAEIDYFLLPGIGMVKRTDLEAGILPQPAMPANPFQLPALASTPPSLAPAAPSVDALKDTGLSACVMLSLANNTDLIALQKQLQGMFQEVEWNKPGDFHITVCYVPSLEESQLQLLADTVKALPCPAMTLRLGSLHTFDNLGNYALHFRVRRSTELEEYQEALYNTLQSAGFAMSAYSSPDSYIPHITMGYAKVKPASITYQSKLTVMPDKVLLTSSPDNGDENTILFEAPLAPMVIEQKAHIPNPNRDLKVLELGRWRKKYTKDITAPFMPEYIGSATADFIRMDLAAGVPAKEVFENAIKAAKIDDPDFATPEEFEAYWRGIGGLYEALQRAFITSWQDLPEKLANDIREHGENANLEFWIRDTERDFTERIIGTESNPGELVKVILAGAARGNDLLASASKADELSIAWDLLNREAFDWARQFANEQVTLIGQTTRKELQDNLSAWIASGEPLTKLADVLEGTLDINDMTIPAGFSPDKIKWLTSPERAALIAQTEVTQAFSQGAITRWKQAGVSEIRWRTNADSIVCKLCRRLNNKTGAITQGVYDEETGKYYLPPAHVGCRCPLSVVPPS